MIPLLDHPPLVLGPGRQPLARRPVAGRSAPSGEWFVFGDSAVEPGTCSRYGQLKEGQIEDEAQEMKHQVRFWGRPSSLVSGALTAWMLVAAPPARAFTARQPLAPAQDAPGVLVSVDWLAERLQDSSVVLLHVGMPTTPFPGEFIPGARFLNYQDVVQVRNSLIVEMPPIDELVARFALAGISDETLVVLYGSPAHLPARVFVTLDYLGHGARTVVLDGGLEAWKAAEYPVAENPVEGPTGLFTPRGRGGVLVSADWIEQRLGDPGITLIDSRPEGEYTGRIPTRIGGRAGHIPGARNLYWEDLLVTSANPVLRDFQSVQDRFQGAGANYGSIVVNYCWVGMRASYTYLIAKHLGYDTRLYDGSWNEWSKNDSLPAVTGLFPG
jgi:thiosulfate/3-mercaptopyruvate sulfurtransferase